MIGESLVCLCFLILFVALSGPRVGGLGDNFGNDALDFSGSLAELKDITISGVGDKGLSAGEKSTINVNNLLVQKSEIGITSKDLSNVNIKNLNLDDVRLGIAVFKKKEEYGGASVNIDILQQKKLEEVYLIDFFSTLNIDNKPIMDRKKNVEKRLYGNTFGKSSK